MGKYFYTLASHFFPAFSLLHSLSLCPAPPPLPPLVLSCFAFIFINSFHNIYFISNISFAKRKKMRILKKSERMKEKKLDKERQSGRVFVHFLFPSFNSILVHWCFCFRFLFVLFLYVCVCISFFFGCRTVELYFSSFSRLVHCLDTTSLMFFHLRVHTFALFIRSLAHSPACSISISISLI